MATSYSANRGPALDAATITEAAAAEPAADMVVSFQVGVTKDEQVFMLQQLAGYIVSSGQYAAVAAP